MGLLRIAIGEDANDGIPALSHRLPIEVPGSELPVMHTVDLAPDSQGTFLVTCRELPGILTFGAEEEEAIAMAVMAVEDELAGQR
jgi:hypothetical protein